jgi:hypothetical protein
VSAFDGVFAKLDRADEHIKTLYKKVQRWTLDEPYTFTNQDNSEKSERSYHIRLERAPDLLGWGVRIGDAVHNLRSSLDHIAWVCAGGDGVAPDWTEFPVFRDKSAYLSSDRVGGLNKISGIMNPVHRALIKECQPWRNPDGYERDDLWILHEFDRVDKHRVVTPILFVPLNMKGKVLVTYETEEAAKDAAPPLIVTPPQAPIYDGAEVFRIVTSQPFVDMQVDNRVIIGVALEYGDASTYRGGSNFILSKLAKRAREVAEQFRDAGL